MEEDQKLKYVCRLCNNRYPCGRSLGGHMRSHMIVNSGEAREKVKPNMIKVSSFNGGRSSKRESVFEAGGQSGYGLRENPKKTWRLVDSSLTLQQDKVCKECGKGFQSLKALFGHMTCHHSEKGRVLNSLKDDDHSWTSTEDQKLVMESQSDNDVSAAPRRRKRSRTMRYKALAVYSSSFSLANGSSSVSEIEQEQEDVAMCLMMLSRDTGFWGGVNSVAESSDNNSVVLEARSSSIDMRIAKNEGLNFMSNGDETVEIRKPRNGKLKSGVLDDAEIVESENSDSGYFRNGAKKVESEVSVDGFLRNYEFKKPKVDGGSGFKVSDAELGKGLNRLKCIETELEEDLIKEEGYNQVDRDSMKYKPRKRTKNNSSISELWGDSCKKITHDSSNVEVCKNAPKRSKYECLTCNKIFHSYQALGGHRTSHKKNNGCCASRYESGENSIETCISPDQIRGSKLIKYSCSGKNPIDQDLSSNAEKRLRSKKRKGYECPICLKVFQSGQALGGHKRSHFVGGSEDKSNRTLVIKQEVPQTPDLLDLNLPAPIEEEANGHAGFMSW